MCVARRAAAPKSAIRILWPVESSRILPPEREEGASGHRGGEREEEGERKEREEVGGREGRSGHRGGERKEEGREGGERGGSEWP